jgi:hypothetical protein
MLDFLDNPACLDVCGKLWKGLRFKLREARYTHCVILAGTNDVGGCKGSAEDIFKNIDKLAKVAKDFGCETFVMTIPELREEKNHRNMENIRISANRLLMQSESLNTIDLSTLVPYHRLTRADRDRIWEPDGVHLRPAGYSKIAHAVAQRLRQLHLDAPPVGKEVVAEEAMKRAAPPVVAAEKKANLQQHAAAYGQQEGKVQQQQPVQQQQQQAAYAAAMQQEAAMQQQQAIQQRGASGSALSMTPTLEAEAEEDNDEIDKYKEYWYFEENRETGNVEVGRHVLADTEHIRGGSLGLPGGVLGALGGGDGGICHAGGLGDCSALEQIDFKADDTQSHTGAGRSPQGKRKAERTASEVDAHVQVVPQDVSMEHSNSPLLSLKPEGESLRLSYRSEYLAAASAAPTPTTPAPQQRQSGSPPFSFLTVLVQDHGSWGLDVGKEFSSVNGESAILL